MIVVIHDYMISIDLPMQCCVYLVVFSYSNIVLVHQTGTKYKVKTKNQKKHTLHKHVQNKKTAQHTHAHTSTRARNRLHSFIMVVNQNQPEPSHHDFICERIKKSRECACI